MANGPAFTQACDLAHACGLAAHTGLHFVLDEGEPLTDALRREPRFCRFDGRLLPRRPGKLPWLSSTERRAVATELRAQIARCRAFGLGLTHIDSHHHIHEEMGVIRVMLPVMREQGIYYIRPMQNLKRPRTLLRHIYTCAFNATLNFHGVARTRYFGSPKGFLEWERRHRMVPTRGSIELMVHPTVGTNGTIIDRLDNSELSELIKIVRIHCRFDLLA